VAAEYLTDLGVPFEHAVKLLVVSHWHDDHIQGAADLLSEALEARAVCSAAVLNREFLTWLAATEGALLRSSGVDELRRILKLIEARAPRQAAPAPILAKSCVMLLRAPATGARPEVEVHALSPSDAAMRLAWQDIAQGFPQVGLARRRIVALTPNRVAVVLSVKVGVAHVILGADLENSADAGLGWRAVLSLDTRTGHRAQVFKIPHHGSEDADNADVWRDMLGDEPVGLLTPFAAGRKFLPAPDDLSRYAARTGELYCTAQSGGWKPPRRSIDKMIGRVVRQRRVVHGPPGHIRVRLDSLTGVGGPVHVCGSAYRFTGA
jgi:hypothetical protein